MRCVLEAKLCRFFNYQPETGECCTGHGDLNNLKYYNSINPHPDNGMITFSGTRTLDGAPYEGKNVGYKGENIK